MNLVSSHPVAVHVTKCGLAAESLRQSGMLRIRVNGWSMLPAICPGDVLLIQSLNGYQVSPGDIVLFQRHQRLFIHRVLRCDESSVVTRGDAMPAPDPALPADDVLGKVQYVLREKKTMVPGRKLRFHERTVANLIRHSNAAARFIVGINGLRQRWQLSVS